ncbi:MAG: hypothetical protein WCG26_12755 [Chloroflexales bacterium]
MSTPAAESLTHPKIAPAHCARLASIYVRQSSAKQVAQNRESQDYSHSTGVVERLPGD